MLKLLLWLAQVTNCLASKLHQMGAINLSSLTRGENDRETLTKVQKGELTFDMEAFANISPEAKDFIAKLLQFKVLRIPHWGFY